MSLLLLCIYFANHLFCIFDIFYNFIKWSNSFSLFYDLLFFLQNFIFEAHPCWCVYLLFIHFNHCLGFYLRNIQHLLIYSPTGRYFYCTLLFKKKKKRAMNIFVLVSSGIFEKVSQSIPLFLNLKLMLPKCRFFIYLFKNIWWSPTICQAQCWQMGHSTTNRMFTP